MTPINALQRILTMPAHAAAAVAGTSAGLLATGVRRASHLVGRTAGHVAGTATPSGPWPTETAPRVEVPSPAPAQSEAAEAAASVPEPRRAPSAQAAVLAPALGLSEAEVEEITGDGDDHGGQAPDGARAEDG